MDDAAKRAAENARNRAWRREYLKIETPERRVARRARKSASQRAYYRRNREAILARERAARANRGAISDEQDSRRRDYLEANRESIRERKRKWKASLSDERLAQLRLRKRENHRRWREANPDRWREWRRQYRLKNVEKNRQAYRRWYEQNRDAVLARKRVKYQEDLERMRERSRIQHGKRRKWIAAGGVNYTLAEWQALVAAWDRRCAYCGDGSAKLQPDHRLPVARGGANSIDNILPSCPPCNFRKHTMTEEEFRGLLERETRGLGEPVIPYDARTVVSAA
jgi:hypothetical protein